MHDAGVLPYLPDYGRIKELGVTHRSNVDIPTPVDKSSRNRRHNPSETSGNIRDIPDPHIFRRSDIDLAWYIGCVAESL